MIAVKLLNSDATLNNFTEQGTLPYMPGENLDVVLRIFNAQRDTRFIPVDPAAEVTFIFMNKDGTALEKEATVLDALDRSMWKVTLSQAETENLAGSNIQVKLDETGDGTSVRLAVIYSILTRLSISGEC